MSVTELLLGACLVFLGFSLDALHRISEYLKRLVELEEKHDCPGYIAPEVLG